MSTLDEITKEKQRVGEALARVDAQHEKLAGQLGELEAAERVLARYSTGTRVTKKALAKTPTTAMKAAAPARSRGRPRTAAACKGARPNHVGMALARHKRAGRIEERDGKLYATQSMETVQPAAI